MTCRVQPVKCLSGKNADIITYKSATSLFQEKAIKFVSNELAKRTTASVLFVALTFAKAGQE